MQHDAHHAHHTHQGHHATHSDGGSGWAMAARATLHCLTGCAIGEILGMVVGTALGWGNVQTMVLAIVLAFFFGYALTLRSVLSSGVGLRAAVKVALAADTVSIAVMELIGQRGDRALAGSHGRPPLGRDVLDRPGPRAGGRLRRHDTGQQVDDRPRKGACRGTTPPRLNGRRERQSSGPSPGSSW